MEKMKLGVVIDNFLNPHMTNKKEIRSFSKDSVYLMKDQDASLIKQLYDYDQFFYENETLMNEVFYFLFCNDDAVHPPN